MPYFASNMPYKLLYASIGSDILCIVDTDEKARH